MRHFLIIISLLISFNANSLSVENRLNNPVLESKAKEIFKQIRCVTCDGESINDSQAEVAVSMRNIIRTKVSQGNEEQQIIAMFIKSYGDSVLMKPPFKPTTFLLWALPFIMIFLAIVMLYAFLRKQHN